MDYRSQEIKLALAVYHNIMSEIHDKRLHLDAQEIDAYHDLINTLNAETPSSLHPVFRPHFPRD